MLRDTCEEVLGRRKVQHEWISRSSPTSPTDRQASEGQEATEEQLERWVEHFGELLNRPTPETSPNIQPADTDLPIDCNKSYKTKIRIAFNTL